MKPERWQRLDELFHLALEREADARSSFVAQATAGDEDLRRELDSMLLHFEQSNSFIETPAYAVAAEEIVEDESPERLIGTTLGPYRILDVLGKGGMGVVYRAVDEELQRKVALKFLHTELTADKSRILRFKQEARAASALNHPNILTVFAIGEVDGRHYISTELVEGETLRELMKSRQLSLSQILSVASQISSALGSAHAAGIMHRDIKPENIMMRPDGYLKVLDFGIAKLIEPSISDSELSTLINTEQGTIIGTIQYMSPEQARGLAVDARTDIWSLGVVLFEMLAGHPPFEGKTKSDVMVAILEHEPPALQNLNAGTADAIQRIVTKALRKDRQERYQSTEELLADLRGFEQSEASVYLERSLLPNVNRHLVAETARQRAKATDDPGAIRPAFSAEYIVSEIKQHKLRVGAVLAVLALVLTSASFWIFRYIERSQPAGQLQTMSLSRLTTSGKARGAAISPDGKYVAYVKHDDGRRSLWVRQVGTTSDIQISSQIDAGGLVFSPDGAHLYYRNFFGDLSRMHMLGGASNLLLKGVNSSIAFSPDGKRFAFLRANNAGTEGMSLLVANADGTGEGQLASRQHPESFDQAVAWSPDGKVIACGVRHTDAQGTYMSVVQVHVESGQTEAITRERWLEVTDLVWLSDGTGLLVVVAEQGSLLLQKIWKISYLNGEASRLTNDLGTYYGLSMTADSKTLVTIEEGRAANIWVTRDGDSATARQVTPRTGKYLGVSWTPDGKLVYSSDASGNWDIWTKGTSEGDERQLTSNQNANIFPSVSPDGRYVLFTSNRSGNVNVWRMNIDGGNAKQLTDGNYDYASSCSPDGQWVVYVHQASCRPSLWKVSIDGGQPVQLTNENSGSPVFSPDGKLIACSYGNNKVAIIPADGGQPLKTFDIPTPFGLEPGFQWTPDARALTYVETRDGVSNIWSLPVAGGPPKQLTDFKSEEIFSFALSRDRQLAISRGMETGDVVLITNLR